MSNCFANIHGDAPALFLHPNIELIHTTEVRLATAGTKYSVQTPIIDSASEYTTDTDDKVISLCDYSVLLLDELKHRLPDEVIFLGACAAVLDPYTEEGLPQDAYTYSAELYRLAGREPHCRSALLRVAATLEQLLVPVLDSDWINITTRHRANAPLQALRPEKELTSAQIELQNRVHNLRWREHRLEPPAEVLAVDLTTIDDLRLDAYLQKVGGPRVENELFHLHFPVWVPSTSAHRVESNSGENEARGAPPETDATSPEHYLAILYQLKNELPENIDLFDECIRALMAQPGANLPCDAHIYSRDLRALAGSTPYCQKLLDVATFVDRHLTRLGVYTETGAEPKGHLDPIFQTHSQTGNGDVNRPTAGPALPQTRKLPPISLNWCDIWAKKEPYSACNTTEVHSVSLASDPTEDTDQEKSSSQPGLCSPSQEETTK